MPEIHTAKIKPARRTPREHVEDCQHAIEEPFRRVGLVVPKTLRDGLAAQAKYLFHLERRIISLETRLRDIEGFYDQGRG